MKVRLYEILAPILALYQPTIRLTLWIGCACFKAKGSNRRLLKRYQLPADSCDVALGIRACEEHHWERERSL